MASKPLNFENITENLATKSAKIRALGSAGVPTGDIARYLGIRYQHARNVLKDAGIPANAKARELMPAPSSSEATMQSAWLNITDDGDVTIPRDLLARASFRAGALIYVGVTDEGLEILSREAVTKRLQSIATKYKRPGISEVDEFIKDRRRETEAEDAKWRGALGR